MDYEGSGQLGITGGASYCYDDSNSSTISVVTTFESIDLHHVQESIAYKLILLKNKVKTGRCVV